MLLRTRDVMEVELEVTHSFEMCRHAYVLARRLRRILAHRRGGAGSACMVDEPSQGYVANALSAIHERREHARMQRAKPQWVRGVFDGTSGKFVTECNRARVGGDQPDVRAFAQCGVIDAQLALEQVELGGTRHHGDQLHCFTGGRRKQPRSGEYCVAASGGGAA